MRRILAFAVAMAAFTALSAGCAADEVEAREAEYPEPIGYTPPGEVAATQPTPPPPPADPPPSDQAAAEPEFEVVVGDGEEGDQYADTDSAALNDFHSTLDPYGSWGDDPTYGTVWVPSESVVGDDFSPYASAGHWAYDDDYTWVSDYDWGWAPFHYGRWVYATRGWSWIPGRAYAGAWVSWRYGAGNGGYVGWAPLPPAWGWRGGSAVRLGFVPRMPYSFVATRDLFAPSVRGRMVSGPQVGAIGARTQPWVVASPHVGGGGARLGPPPSLLNISASAVVRTSPADTGVMQARAFARPSTGRALGAGVPQAVAGRGSAGAWPYRGGVASIRGEPSANSSHFGGRLLGGGFSGSVGAAPPVPSYPGQGARPYFGAARPGSYSGSPVYRSSGAGYSGPVRSFGGGYSGPVRSFGSGMPSGAARPAAGFSGGGAVGGTFHGGGGGGFHGGGGGGSRGGGRGGRR